MTDTYPTVDYQEELIAYLRSSIQALSEPAKSNRMLTDTLRPNHVSWLMNNISLLLWVWMDNRTFIKALVMAKACLNVLDIVMAVWPSPGMCSRFSFFPNPEAYDKLPEQAMTIDQLRSRIRSACMIAPLSPPPPALVSAQNLLVVQ